VHLGERLVQAARAVGDQGETKLVVILDLRALMEFLRVLDRERVKS